ncbi:hypothetical protein AWZ03_006485 [Drosophila navojoa]|uniref:carboxylesterase n=1 Tax=Drosophila navojoa TaxID=7232 RepID=A0A484BE93_DRONA|nr:hypothetical protein AWZ03_006485 [Drosophila navojoa]
MTKTILHWILLSTIGYIQADLDVCLQDLGCLHGTLMPDSRQEQFEAFMGIPFAQPPIGELRFKNPVAAGAWTGVLDASAPRSHCLQKCYFMPGWPISGEEDCLYLNVYRPQGVAGPLPVMVYIHAGGYLCGSACPLASGPEFLMDTQQVIVVTVSYRLGPFGIGGNLIGVDNYLMDIFSSIGFLSTGDAHMTGNFGLKDQRLALQWVQQHISAFGGDPNLVTIFGHSAGGVSTHLLMLSPSSNGLFHRAMSLSGTAMLGTTMVYNPLEQAQQLAERVGVANAKSLDTQALAAALRASDANDLLEAGNVFKRWDSVPIINYAAVVEQPDAPEPFITEYPIPAHMAGRINQVPWLLSSTSRVGEGALFIMHIYMNPQLLKEFNENFLELFGLMMYLPAGHTKETVQDILEMYGVKEMQLNENTLVDLCGILGDFLFTYPLYVSASSYAAYAQQPVSIYSFEFTSKVTYGALLTGGVVFEQLGASHLDDAIHTIRMPIFFPDFPKGSENDIVTKRLASLLVEFAWNGQTITNHLGSDMIHAGLTLPMLSVLLLLMLLGSGQSTPSIAVAQKALIVCGGSLGCLKGIHMPGYQIKRFEAFLGIPYALPPVGKLRFSNPKVMPKLRGIYNASVAKPDCIQKNYLLPTPLIYGEEDCLYLNVYRPERRSRQPLPVMVYIHGGGFFSGSAGPQLTGPEYFMDTGEVILVSMAYRLGALGFLSTQDSAVPGNFGLKDQQLALRWVQRHIKFFGGDPRRVTIFGQSAGGVATHLHMLSSRSAGLFQQAISMSGTANVPFSIEQEPLQQARRTAELCHVENAQNLSTPKLARALRAVDVQTLLNAGDGLKFWNVDHMSNYRPVVESSSEDAFLSVHPKQLLAEGSYQQVPWLLSTVPQEGAVRVVNIMENVTLRQDFNARFDELLQELLELPKEFSAEQLAQTMQLVIEKYFQNSHELNEQTVQGFLDLISDRGFKQPLYNAIWQHLSPVHASQQPLYLYSFNYRGPLSYASVYTSANVGQKYGVVHCDDLIYLFRSPMLFPDFERNSTEARVVESLVGYFVHFAKFGKPRNAETLTRCTESILESRPAGICDHHVFDNALNDPKQFEVNVSQNFRSTSAKFWNDILGEPKRY